MTKQPHNLTYNLSHNSMYSGLYIHIPFCIKKCRYCDFYSITDLSLIPIFLQCLEKEIELTNYPKLTFDSLYLGGGTPSVLSGSQISRILTLCFNRFKFKSDSEITIEVNPGTKPHLKDYKQAGVNRINIGVQSFNPTDLNFLGRIHSSSTAKETLKSARDAGFGNIGLDIIYGMPEQNLESLETDLKQAVYFNPEHISAYSLTIESTTPLGKDLKKGLFKPLSEESLVDMMHFVSDFLNSNGYQRYEISNYAKDTKFRSNHNQKYWNHNPYVGLGPSAHSFINPKRYWNHVSINKYITALNAQCLPVDNFEILNSEQFLTEAIYLGLRQSNGFDMATLKGFTNIIIDDLISDLKEQNLCIVDNNHLKLTRKGMIFADRIAQMIIDRI